MSGGYRMHERNKDCKQNLGWKSLWEKISWKVQLRYENNFKEDVIEIGYEDVNQTEQVQDQVEQRDIFMSNEISVSTQHRMYRINLYYTNYTQISTNHTPETTFTPSLIS